MTPAALASWKSGRRTPSLASLRRLTACSQGDNPEAREQRVAMYEQRAAARCGLFTGEPAVLRARPVVEVLEELRSGVGSD